MSPTRPGHGRGPLDDTEYRSHTTGTLPGEKHGHSLGGYTDPAPRPGHGDSPEHARYETGTTIVAVRADTGVVMAADKRMSLGGRFTANKNVEKISQIHPTGALAISGSVGPAQDLIRSLQAEASLYEARRDEPMSMTALSRTASQLVRGLPVQPLLAGVDDDGGHVFELDGGGSALEDEYAAGGSGMQTAYGVLEGRAEDDPTLSAAREAATDAVVAASERDTASGNGVTVVSVTEAGIEIENLEGGEN